MGRNKKWGNITIADEDRTKLEKIANSQTEEYRKVQRAKILLLSADGMSNTDIAAAIGVHRNTVATFITKYSAAGFDYAMNDSSRSGKPNVISDDEKTWITSIACIKPKEIGYAEELWTFRALQKHIRTHCNEAGYPGLSNISHSTVRAILEDNAIKPNKMTYYLVRKDPDFDKKMHDVLVVYKQVEMCFDEEGNITIDMDEPKTVTVSYDEKPGIQALKNIAPDLPPTEKHGKVARDYEYKRLGTLSLLAGIDLLTGKVIPLVSETHKSSDFITWLKKVDSIYPEQDTIRLVLDNHSAHTSKETQAYLNTRPGRFEFVFTPTHGSWLNLIESFFSKLTKQCLKGIRVDSKQELSDRIYQYMEQVNDAPVVYHWKYKMDETTI
ncbi:MAG: IS630 family transposase [Lachnospiraceae bacterium]|nr:IS630 family transposase [Lachnospiraceae bacterium]